MKTKFIKSLIVLSVLLFGYVPLLADDYVVIAKTGNVYDEANAKYITVNQNNDDVSVIPGMVFATSQHTPGWFKIEYSPGLHAFIPDKITATSLVTVVPGTYNIVNLPGHNLTVEKAGDNWSAQSEGILYKGIQFQDIILFKDNNNNIIYSIVDLGNGPIAITYDNSVTKFF